MICLTSLNYVLFVNKDLYLQQKGYYSIYMKMCLLGRDKTIPQQFSVIRCHLWYLEIPISRTNFRFPWRFEKSGFHCISISVPLFIHPFGSNSEYPMLVNIPMNVHCWYFFLSIPMNVHHWYLCFSLPRLEYVTIFHFTLLYFQWYPNNIPPIIVHYWNLFFFPCDSEVGTPRVLWCDNGGELKKAVQHLCQNLGVKITRSSAYHLQSQGKIEWSHHSLHKKIMFDRLQMFKVGVNRVLQLKNIKNFSTRSWWMF